MKGISNIVEQTINEFLPEVESLMARIDDLPYTTVVDLYELLEITSKSATAEIKSLNTELRTILCAHQDEVLERIVDTQPSDHEFSGKSAGIYTPAVQGYRRWTNTELLKDKCLTGYMLARTLGSQSTMYFGTQPSDYSYLSVLPGLEMMYHDAPNGTVEVYYEHLAKNYLSMDVLILHGMYDQTIEFLNAYRQLRPDGKVYCGLDMNSTWMSRIDWEHPKIQRFAEQCDIIATSCTSLRNEINRNPSVNFPCRWLPNGFLNPTDHLVIADANHKENIILTVGRIGTAQKNNAELLIAFAKVSNVMEGWSLRLVGSIEPEFESFINEYFTLRPDLKDRVIFTGPITNKTDLYNEYARAKIFALTSQLEGGTPNVYAEALFHGCMFVTSNIDAADDITGYGALGQQYSLSNVDDLADALIALLHKSSKSALEQHIPMALDYAQRYYDWNRNAKKLAYMLYKE